MLNDIQMIKKHFENASDLNTSGQSNLVFESSGSGHEQSEQKDSVHSNMSIDNTPMDND
jgi:hypothetical protein